MPILMGLITVFDAETGKPKGVTEAVFITGIWTGASVRVAGRDKVKLKKIVDTIPSRLQLEFGMNVEKIMFEEMDSLDQAVKHSDIIISVMPSRTPIIKREWVKKAHIFLAQVQI